MSVTEKIQKTYVWRVSHVLWVCVKIAKIHKKEESWVADAKTCELLHPSLLGWQHTWTCWLGVSRKMSHNSTAPSSENLAWFLQKNWKKYIYLHSVQQKWVEVHIPERVVCRSKQGWRGGHQQRKQERCPESTVSHHKGEYYGTRWGGGVQSRATYTHHSECGLDRAKSKTRRVVVPIFLPFSLLLLFHRAPLVEGGEYQRCIGSCLTAAWIISLDTMESNLSGGWSALVRVSAQIGAAAITGHHLRCHWPLIHAITRLHPTSFSQNNETK